MGENSPYINIHQISSAYLYSYPNFFSRHRGNRLGKEVPHDYQARYQCFSRLPLLPKHNFSLSASVPALVLMEQPMEKLVQVSRGFANRVAKVFSLLLMAQNHSWVSNWLFLLWASSYSYPGNQGRSPPLLAWPMSWSLPSPAALLHQSNRQRHVVPFSPSLRYRLLLRHRGPETSKAAREDLWRSGCQLLWSN